MRLGQPALGVDRRRAATSGGGDGLPVNVIGHVAGGEDAGHIGVHGVVLDEVTILIRVEFAPKGRGVGRVCVAALAEAKGK